MSFFQSVWGSIFEPGTNPQLIIATHISFASLIVVLVWLCCKTQNIHFFALLTIASILWALVTWFVNELKNHTLKDNDQLADDNHTKVEEGSNKKQHVQEPKSTGSRINTGGNSRRTRSRKT